MITLQLGRDSYSKHREMIRWCLDNVGFSAWSKADIDEDVPFCASEMFGHLQITFLRETDAMMFKLHYGGEQIYDRNRDRERQLL